MRILMFNKKSGEMKILPETENDWLVLAKIIKKGDIVKGESTRSITIDKGSRKEKVRKKVFVEIEVESTELTDSGIRAKGVILNESEHLQKGSYHTFEITSKPFVLKKQWNRSEVSYIRQFEKKIEEVVVVLMDDSEAQVYFVAEKPKLAAEYRFPSGKSLGEQPKNYKELAESIRRHGNSRLIIAGPGFAKEKLAEVLKDMNPVVDSVSHTGEAGLREVIRRGLIERLSKNQRIGHETHLVERFFEEIARNGMVAYGKENVRKFIEMGAVETLLISDKFITDPLIQEAEKYRTKVEIISSEHDAGKRLLAFGGYGAFLRFK